MAKRRSVFRGLLMWSYDRGTLQYDIICALILAFIFLVPRSCLVGNKQTPMGDSGSPAQGEQIKIRSATDKLNK